MTSSTELLGLIAGGFTIFAFVPQVLKVWRSHYVKDISIWVYSIFCFGLAMWIIYGIYMKSAAIILANVIMLSLASSILFMKILWNRIN